METFKLICDISGLIGFALGIYAFIATNRDARHTRNILNNISNNIEKLSEEDKEKIIAVFG